MKKRVISALLVTSILFHAMSTDIVSFAGDLDDFSIEQSEETNGDENVAMEEEETEPEEVVEEEVTDETDESDVTDSTLGAGNSETETVEETVPETEVEIPEAEKIENEENEEEDVEFSQSKEVSGVSISLYANPGVLPEGAYFEAEEITSTSQLTKMSESIEAQLDDSKKVTDIKAFDITIYDADGNEIQPDTDKGNVFVTFKNSDIRESISDSKTDVEVFHVSDSMTSAEAVNSTAGGDKVEFEAEHFSPYAVVSIEDNEKDNTKEIDENALIESVKIYKVDSSNNEVELTADGDNVISKDDTIRVKYVFKTMSIVLPDQEKYAVYDYVYPNKSYRIPGVPENCVRADGSSITVTNGSTNLGEITFESDGKAILKIADFVDNVEEAKSATAGFDLKLDLSGLGDSNKSSYDLKFGNNTTIKVNVDEFMPKAPTVSKNASTPDANGYVTWTVKVKNDSNPIQYKDGYTFTDTFGSGQDYVSDSFKVNESKRTIRDKV